ncbi:MAG TPA: hypothetical protein VNK45_02395, partial [Candidatus Acidoferrales bacterium]|nr:hypothetical protein [Candidatus Acidoferrales bacterium]
QPQAVAGVDRECPASGSRSSLLSTTSRSSQSGLTQTKQPPRNSGRFKTFRKIMGKYFGIKVTQKGIITKTLPIIGGLIGGTWNYIEISGIKKRIIKYFEGDEV